jgi:hypothetical protein
MAAGVEGVEGVVARRIVGTSRRRAKRRQRRR